MMFIENTTTFLQLYFLYKINKKSFASSLYSINPIDFLFKLFRFIQMQKKICSRHKKYFFCNFLCCEALLPKSNFN